MTYIQKEMTARQVLQILQIFKYIHAQVWLAGGWGIDALIGQQTRKHNDVDIAFNAQDEERIIETFYQLGYSIVEDARPTRFVLRKMDGTEIDMHPVVFDDSGVGKQLVPGGEPFLYPKYAFAQGIIDEQKVPCLSVNQQVVFHTGYVPLAKDRHNINVLHEHFSIPLPDAYEE